MIPTTRIHELARRTAQRFVNDEDPALRLYVFEGRHLEDFVELVLNEGGAVLPQDTEGSDD